MPHVVDGVKLSEPPLIERTATVVLGTFIACAMQTMERLLQDPVDAEANLRP